MTVTLSGRGVAASCCAHLLRARGIATTMSDGHRPAGPVVMLSDAALALVREVFEAPGLFAGAPRVTRRIVAWGGADPVAMPHDATIVTAAAIGSALGTMVARAPSASDVGSADFTIHSAAPLPSGEPMRFGAREATAVPARFRDPAVATDCWIESLDAGWLFLIPTGEDGAGWLLSVGAPLDAAIAGSRHIIPRVMLDDARCETFDPAPRIAPRPVGSDWLACGSAAIAFDPICGDGTAQAVRGAILAASVVGAMRDGGNAEALTGHYQAMLTAAMRRHLQLCEPFYRSGGDGRWWQEAHDALMHGHDWCTRRLSAAPAPRYVLRGYDLVEREIAA